MRKGLRRDVQLNGAFPAAVICVSNELESWDQPNLKRRDVGLPLGGWLSTCHWRWPPALASMRFSFCLTSLWPPQFQSPPGSLFTFGSKSASCTGTKHGQEKKRTPILSETNQQWAQQVICGLLGRTGIAFLSQLCAAIEAGLQHFKSWHRHLGWDLELLQEAQETRTSGQKLEAGSTRGCSGGWMI